MNGAQDLGGAMGFGPVVPEPDEPVFHAEWERRAFAITVAAGFTAQWNIDMARSARESMPPAQYLASSYYQIWLSGLERLLVARGMLGDQELPAALSGQKPTTVLRNEKAAGRCVGLAKLPAVLAAGGPTERPAPQPARFSVGDAVRTVVIHPTHHTRLPRYARGKRGRVLAMHGAHVFPDTNAQGLGAQPSWLYTVQFEAGELWGPDSTASSVCVDCWEPYLLPEPGFSQGSQ
ncbi:MAG: nitrile hydratase subunit beta [Quisquiliibacterium sp.]